MSWPKAAALALVAFLLPIKALVIGAIVLVILNTGSGIFAAKKRGERITAKWWSRPVAKLICWPLALVVAHVVGVVMFGGLVPVAAIVASAIGTYELASCLRNVSTLTGANITEAVISRVSAAIEPAPKVQAVKADDRDAA